MTVEPKTALSICEVGPRDGLQNETKILSVDTRVELIVRLAAAGVRRIEAGSFVSPKAVPQMANTAQVVARARELTSAQLAALVVNEQGVQDALTAGVDEVRFVIVASETLSQRNQRASIAETLLMWPRLAAQVRDHGKRLVGLVGAAFGCPFEGEVPQERVLEIVEQLEEQSPDEIILADTIGSAVPSQVRELLRRLRQVTGDRPLGAHFHNTRNTGLANAYAAIEERISTLDASVGGVGGCPFSPKATGNVPSEDLVYMLHRMGVNTGIDLEGLIGIVHWLSEQLDRDLPGLVSKAGPFPVVEHTL